MTRRYLPLLALVLASGTVGADPHDEANRIHAEARQLIAQQCRKDNCPVFAAATAKLKKAYAIEPDDMIAGTYCSLLGLVKLTPEQEREMLAMCDAGDPDRAEALRAKRIEKGRASSALEAARALFGIGLTVSEPNFPKKGGETLAWGSVTAEKLQDYIRDHYVDVITNSEQLRQPEKKLAACKAIAGHGRDAAEKTAITHLCEFEIARERSLDYLTFGGDSGLERIAFKDMPVFQQDAQLRYRPMFVLASKRRFDMYVPLTEQRKLLDAIVKQGSQHTYFKQASDMLAALDANIKKLTEEGARAKKLLAANKTKVLFLPHSPKEWDVPAPLAAKTESCDRYLYAIGPDLHTAEESDVALEVTVDGKPCFDSYGREGMVKETCPDLFGKGEHKLAATMYRVKWKKTGEKQITVHKNSIDVRDKEQSSRGATVARGQLTCGGN